MSRERQPYVTVTIANNASASSAFELSGWHIVGVISPAAWTGADITFSVDPTGAGTFYPVVDAAAGAVIRLTGIGTSTAEFHAMPAASSYPFITGQDAKVLSTNTASEAAVNQGGARTLIVVIAPN